MSDSKINSSRFVSKYSMVPKNLRMKVIDSLNFWLMFGDGKNVAYRPGLQKILVCLTVYERLHPFTENYEELSSYIASEFFEGRHEFYTYASSFILDEFSSHHRRSISV